LQALNTVYTFCQTRKSLATTFDNLKSSVEGLLKRFAAADCKRLELITSRRPLDVHDVAQIKSLLPNLIKFAYLDQEALQVHLHGADAGKGKEKEDSYTTEEKPEKTDLVLFFQFNDGELKSSNKGGKVLKKRLRFADPTVSLSRSRFCQNQQGRHNRTHRYYCDILSCFHVQDDRQAQRALHRGCR
jgi:DEAD/DEAH box helicase domain-containing protein